MAAAADRLGPSCPPLVCTIAMPFTPWRFDTASYLVAGDVGQPLTGTPVEAHWDPALTTTMQHTGRRIEEELVLDDLLGDLAG